MESLNRSLSLLFIVVCSLSWVSASANSHDDFLECLYSYHPKESSSFTQVIYTETNSSYSAVLDSSIRNHRFSMPNTPKPLVIVIPLNISHVQATIHCSKKHGLQIRTRSGGHDFEGLSYVSHVPFVVIDLVNLRSVDVDVENEEAWVQSGATVGEVFYRINERSTNLTFAAAVVRTVGIGGLISGGGDGLLFRKYGLSVDNVIDAQLVDANGRVLDRRSMGEDLFWAIRGGGGGSFGIVISWKIKLVHVPSTVTVFSVGRTLEQNATQLLHRWQYVAPNLPNDVYSLVAISTTNASENGAKTVLATFTSLFQGDANEFIPLMQERFPELGLVKEDFIEMTWIESLLLMNGVSNETSEILLDRSNRYSLLPPSFKSKSDYVREPMPEIALQGLWPQLLEVDEGGIAVQNFIAYGGIMEEISETETPFPHRKGTLYKINYNIGWLEEENNNSQRYISWMRKLYSYMGPFVSKSPREAYVNYRDLDIGRNNYYGKTSYKQASIWGRKYFKNNFDRLVYVKTKTDPKNFFKHEQSIPPRFH
ncbi:hypothetical protein ES319_A02G021700v1 [Gossypium barbadense]|uniref:FAD-binding PCMH-type domain-containing protein n=2 Tax=Gossypium TaxID=3633 RepID=A0A5J5WKC8_GOSBA|nr:hypothetical protein ES319_A02G021700v1 [Gossypium barbadense]TYH26855.1 hypothetical protein ES288_A02G022500v1 [Gossypium darwinii]